jgi:hypothetical protein
LARERGPVGGGAESELTAKMGSPLLPAAAAVSYCAAPPSTEAIWAGDAIIATSDDTPSEIAEATPATPFEIAEAIPETPSDVVVSLAATLADVVVSAAETLSDVVEASPDTLSDVVKSNPGTLSEVIAMDDDGGALTVSTDCPLKTKVPTTIRAFIVKAACALKFSWPLFA